jgi:hypothetical protein
MRIFLPKIKTLPKDNGISGIITDSKGIRTT